MLKTGESIYYVVIEDDVKPTASPKIEIRNLGSEAPETIEVQEEEEKEKKVKPKKTKKDE